MSLFSIFEPQAFLNFPFNWLILTMVLLRIPSRLWVAKSRLRYSLKKIILILRRELRSVSAPFIKRRNIILPVTLFITLLILNFGGLLPYVFPSTGHIPFAISLALPLWVGHVIYGWAYEPLPMLAHLVPLGSPGALMPFMVLIELVSSFIRPLTLSVRLVANIVAGHLLLTLLRRGRRRAGLLVLSTIILALFLLSCLERAVATIQAYVFTILSTLYVREVDSISKNS